MSFIESLTLDLIKSYWKYEIKNQLYYKVRLFNSICKVYKYAIFELTERKEINFLLVRKLSRLYRHRINLFEKFWARNVIVDEKPFCAINKKCITKIFIYI